MSDIQLGVDSGFPECDYLRVLTKGEGLRVRRDRLGWSVTRASKMAGISHETVINIEKDRGGQTKKVTAYELAIERGEAAAGIGPPLSAPPATTEPSKEGADVAAILAEAHGKIAGIASMLDGALNDLRRTLARLDDRTGKPRKQA